MGNSLGMSHRARKMRRGKVTSPQLMSCHSLRGKGAQRGQMCPAVPGSLEFRLRLLELPRRISWQARLPLPTPGLLMKRERTKGGKKQQLICKQTAGWMLAK